MENFSPLAPHNHPEFNSREQEGLEKIFFRLRELHEVQDESRNELCPAFLDDDSLHAHHSPWTNPHPHHHNILKELEETGEHALQQPRSLPQTSKRNSTHAPATQDLQLTNLKLRQDNTKLFSECLRLRTLCKHLQSTSNPLPKPTRDTQLQRENAHLKRTLQQLSRDRDRLELKVRMLGAELAEQEEIVMRCEKISGEVELLSRVNQQLADKIVQLERELESSQSRFSSKSSQNGHNSTLESRRTDAEKDRMISNMKIVHESEIRKLKIAIEQLTREQNRHELTGYAPLLPTRKK